MTTDLVIHKVSPASLKPYSEKEKQTISAEARKREKEITELGDGINRIREMQIKHLLWFAEDPRRVQLLGFDDMFEWVRSPEIARALWGRDVVTATTRERFIRSVKLQLLVPEISVFDEVPPSFHSSGTFTTIEDEVRQLPPPDSEDREDAVERVREKIKDEKTKSWEERRKDARKNRTQKFDFSPVDGILRYEGEPALKLVPEAGEVGAELLHLIIRPEVAFVIDADLVKAWIDDKFVIVGRVMTQDGSVIDRIVEALRAERKS